MARKFARLSGVRVAEVIVEVEDISREHVLAFIAECPEVTDHDPPVEVGWVRAEDGSFGPAPPPVLTPARARLVAMGTGCPITSAGTPSLDGTYAADGPAFQDMLSEAQGVTIFHAFSNGAAELHWPVRGGTVTIATTDQLLAVLRGILDWRAAWLSYEIGKGPKPAPTVTIP